MLRSIGGSAKPYAKSVSIFLVFVTSIAVFLWVGNKYDWWRAGVVILAVAIFSTLAPIVLSFLGVSSLNPPGNWFDTAEQLGDQQKRVQDHYSRIEGTLRFWKSKAAAHYRLHLARVTWSLIAGATLPVLVQKYDQKNPWAVLFMTMLTTWTGLIVAFAYTLRSEEKYQGFRQQESDFYDLSRQLLDFAPENAQELREKVDFYISKVNEVRKVGRRVETSSPPSAL